MSADDGGALDPDYGPEVDGAEFLSTYPCPACEATDWIESIGEDGRPRWECPCGEESYTTERIYELLAQASEED